MGNELMMRQIRNSQRGLQQVALLVVATVMLSSCATQVDLGAKDKELVARTVTSAANVVIFPDDNPSIADGKIVWNKLNCAECHGTDGSGIGPQVTVDLRNAELVEDAIPVDQYRQLMYGIPGVKHPLLKDRVTVREAWDLLFYVRSLAIAPLSEAETAAIDPVFGANCAVCHGKRGYGDGPLARNLEPNVANFHQFNRFFDRPDSMLYNHIAEGVYPSAMPGFWNRTDKAQNVTFDEPYIDKLVLYVRAFSINSKSRGQASP